jgi:hypothetical protein
MLVGAALLAGIAGAIAGLLFTRHALAERWLVAQLEAAGLRPASLRVEDLGVGGIRIRDVTIGDAAASVARVDVDWTLPSLLRGGFERVAIVGVRVRGVLDEQGLRLEGVAMPLTETGDGGTAAVLPAPELRIEDARAEISTPEGEATATLELDLAERQPGRLAGEARFDATHPRGSARGTARAEGTLERLEGGFELELALDWPGVELGRPLDVLGSFVLADGALEANAALEPFTLSVTGTDPVQRASVPELSVRLRRPEAGPPELELRTAGMVASAEDLEARGVDVTARMQGTSWTADLRAAQLRDVLRPARIPPLDVRATAWGDAARASARATVRGAEGKLVVNTDGRLDIEHLQGSAQFELEPMTLGPGGVDPSRLAPAFATGFVATGGEVAAHGRATFGENAPEIVLEAALRDVSVSGDAFEARGVNGTIQLRGPDPIETIGDQLISVAVIDVGLPLLDGLVRYRLLPSGVLDIPAARFAMADGAVRTRAHVDPAAGGFDAVLVAEDLDLALLLGAIDLDGLSGTGRMSGRLPIVASETGVLVDGGRLAGLPPGGRIVYQPAPTVEAAAANQPSSLGLALGALSDFIWETLELELDGDAQGEMDIGVHLRGSNPEFQRGRSVELNVNLEARLSDLVQAGLASYRVPEAIEERLRAFAEDAPAQENP